MRLRGRKTPRRFELGAGDELIASPTLGYIVLLKVSGEVIDLNQIVMDLGSTEACMDITKRFDAFHFMQLASILATSYGLSGNSVSVGYAAFVVPVTAPNAPSGDVRPSEKAIKFMSNPQVPSLESVRY